jgi:membrane protease YdiL (CAAX protease family)
VDRLRAELGIGLVAGVGAWAAVLAFMLILGLVLMATGDGAMPGGGEPAPLVAWLAGLPVAWRLGLSLAAGLCEEIFFRGLLQRRIGILASTAIFVLGHVSYGAPLMLVGLTLLSLIYALLARWRGNIWAAVVAHTVFAAVQRLVVIPAALATLEVAQPGAAADAASALSFCYAPA